MFLYTFLMNVHQSIPLQTIEEVRNEFNRRGVSISAWARANQVSEQLTYQVLSGKKRCLRGQSHDIAVLLGIKAGEISSTVGVRLIFQPESARGGGAEGQVGPMNG